MVQGQRGMDETYIRQRERGFGCAAHGRGNTPYPCHPHPYRPDRTQKEEVGKTGEEELPQEAERCSTAVSQ